MIRHILHTRAHLVLVAALLLIVGGALLGRRTYLGVKGRIAKLKIEAALDAYLEDGRARRPWPWADFRPVAWLEVPRLGESRAVIEGASGASLAFAVGHVDGTSLPGRDGNVVLAGHRDGAFRMLADLDPGDRVRLRTRRGPREYRVQDTHVVSSADTRWLETTAGDRLTLLTCYPFGDWCESGLRFVAVATPCAVTDQRLSP